MSDDLKKERKLPQTEKLLRQFLKLESGLGNSRAFNENYDTAMSDRPPTIEIHPVKCNSCDYVAANPVEYEWHEKRTGHRFPGMYCKP